MKVMCCALYDVNISPNMVFMKHPELGSWNTTTFYGAL